MKTPLLTTLCAILFAVTAFSQTQFGSDNVETEALLDLPVSSATNRSTAEDLAVDDFRFREAFVCVNPTITMPPSSTTVCNTGNTSFTIAATGATGYQWQVNTGSGFTNIVNGGVYSNATTATLTITGATGIMSGYLYRCNATADGGACSTTSSQATLIVSNPTLTANSQTNIACFGGNTGSATVNAAGGGISPYTYNWTPGNPTGDGTTTVTGLTAGSWTCTASDNIGCTAVVNFTITQVAAILVTPNTQTNVSCFGGNTGAASINTPTGGLGGYSYNWTPGNPPGDGSVSVTGLIAQTYTCTVSDGLGCSKTQSFTVTAPPAMVVTPNTQTNVSCFGGSNGAAAINTPTGGAGGYTYNWTPGNPSGDGSTSVTGLTAGTWTCTVTDANSCTASQVFNVTQPPAMVITPNTQTNVSCFSGSNGAAAINTPTGGAGGYTYNWTPGNPSGDGSTSVTGLTAGTWTCTVTDANSCTALQVFNVTQPPAMVVTPSSQTNVSCFSGSNGAAAINTPTGGAGGYTYNWTPGNPSGDGSTSVTGLTAGTWTCTVTDANSCTALQVFNVTQPPAISFTAASQTNIACFGNATGAFEVNAATGGTGSFTYDWTPGTPTGDGTTSVTGLTAGTYSVVATDGNGCTASISFTITQAPALAVTPAAQTNVSCDGGSNGAAAINAPAGGTPGYTYDWTPGTPTGDGTTSVTGLTAGTYTVTVTDANGCSGSQSFTVTEPSAISFTAASQTNVACFGGATGAFEVNPANGGTGAFTYDWTPGTPTGDGTTSVTGLTAGTYSVVATDGNGCTAAISFTITQAPALAVTPAAQTNVSCNSGSNGAAAINTPTGGTPGYTYDWTPGTPTGDGTASVTGLTAGTYIVTVTDANGCTASQSFTVTQPAAVSVTPAAQTNVSCNSGSNGAAAINAPTGGTPGYTYDWTPGTPTGDGTTSVTGLIAGTYTVTVTDANGCTASQSFTVTQPAAVSVTPAAQTNVSCNSGSNGAAAINTPTGGTPGYTYDWTPGTPTGDGTTSVTGLTAGTYSVTVTDANGCAAMQSFTITEPPVLMVMPIMQVNVSCNAGSNGSALIMVMGGTPGYTYSWSPSGGTAASASGLTAGTYTVTVTDANGCAAAQSFTITEPPALIVTAAQTDVSCFGGSNGEATVSVTGGTPGYTYAWSPSGGTAATASGLTAGTYTVTVTDANGCTATPTCTITEPPVLTATISQTNVSCFGGSNGEATVSAAGGTPGYTYSWSPSGGTAATTSGLTAGIYTVDVTDANGCTTTQFVTITEPPVLTASAVAQTNVSCFGGSNGEATVIAAGGTPGYSYSWSPSGGTAATASELTAGTYTVTATDANGCTVVQSFTITGPAEITGTQSITMCNGETFTIGLNTYSVSGTYTDILTAQNGCDSTVTTVLIVEDAIDVATTENANVITATASGAAYQWMNCATNVPVSGETSQTFTPAANGNYAVVVTINGCSDTSACVLISTIGLGEPSSQWNVSVYPNPAKDYFTIDLPENTPMDVTLYDVSGRKVLEAKLESAVAEQVDVRGLATGSYRLVLTNGNKQYLGKIIVNR